MVAFAQPSQTVLGLVINAVGDHLTILKPGKNGSGPQWVQGASYPSLPLTGPGQRQHDPRTIRDVVLWDRGGEQSVDVEGWVMGYVEMYVLRMSRPLPMSGKNYAVYAGTSEIADTSGAWKRVATQTCVLAGEVIL